MRAVGREHAASYRVGGGAKEECMDKICSGGTCLGYFSKVMVNAFITIKLLVFSTSSVMLLSGLKIHHY